MNLESLKRYRLVYLATPYSKYPGGHEKAFQDACEIAGLLIDAGIKVFSPIAHTHPIAMHSGLDHLDGDIWLDIDEPLMEASDALLIVELDGHDESDGISYENDMFRVAGKPRFRIEPITMAVSRCVD